MIDPREFHARMQQLDAVLTESEQADDPAAQARLKQVASALLELHGGALERLVDQLKSIDGGIVEKLAEDEVISALLVLHNLHPLDVEARVQHALAKSKPYVSSHGGNVRLDSITADGVAHLQLEGSCHGCPGSRATLQSMIEQEIYAAAPEICSIEVEGLNEEPEKPAHANGDVFVPLGHLAVKGHAMHTVAAS